MRNATNPTIVTDSAIQRFVNDGFLVAEGLVDGEEQEALIADAARFARGEYKVMNAPQLPPGASDDEALNGILAIHFPHWVSPVMRDAVTHVRIIDVLSRIVGAHLAHWDGRVKCMQSMLFVKPPGFPGQAWHQDERYIPTRDRSLVGAWIALDDATVDNGCLWVIPGSHRMGYLWPTRKHEEPDEYDASDQSYGFGESDAVPVEVAAGSVVFFNGYLLHKSLKNRSDGFRRALVNHYCNAWSLLPWGLSRAEVKLSEVATHDYRNVIVIGDDPYAWRGTDPSPDSVFLRPRGARSAQPG